MADKNAEQIKALYTDLAKIAPSQDWNNILKVAKKILGFNINEKKAFHCKIVSLIQLDKFDEALNSLDNFDSTQNDFYFEKSYCLYRKNRLIDAYNTLKKCTNFTVKEKELLAQVTYRLEKYDESYDTYCDIIKTTQDDYDTERQTNMSAVVAAAKITNQKAFIKDMDMSENEDKTYELCYNSACILLSKGNYNEAEEKLKKAEEMCKKYFEDDEEFTEEDLENEIGIIRVQMAYCLQKLGKSEEAMRIYNTVLKNKPSDTTVVAVASNNIVTLNKDQNVFDSKKKIKTASGNELEFKLNSYQKSAICYNDILLGILTNQKDYVLKMLKNFEEKFNDATKLVKLKVSQFYREKKFDEAEALLKQYQANDELFKYYLVQVLLSRKKLEDAIKVLKSIGSYFNYPGITSAIFYLYNYLNNKTEASNLLNEALKNANQKVLPVYLKENSEYQLKCGNFEKAVEILEKIHKANPKDHRVLSQLINTYSKFNPDKAQKLSEELPSIDELLSNSNLDFEALEQQFSLSGSKYVKMKSMVGAKETPKVVKTPDGEIIKKKSVKKKKKVKLPKNYDPSKPLDTERWLPLRERSYFKGKRNKKKNLFRGAQGSTDPSSQQQQQTSPASSPVNSPRPGTTDDKASNLPKPKANVKQQQKAKKKRGGKW